MFAEESKAKEFEDSTTSENNSDSLSQDIIQREPIGIPALEALQQHFNSGHDKKF